MAITVFKDSSYSLSTLLEEIDRGEIALPGIQRPFVWKPSKVRDLFDSMYKGFPVGHLLFWATGAEVGARLRRRVHGDEQPADGGRAAQSCTTRPHASSVHTTRSRSMSRAVPMGRSPSPCGTSSSSAASVSTRSYAVCSACHRR